MKKMTDILSTVDVKVQPLNSELIYLTENEKQVGSLILIYSGDDASIFSVQVLDNHRGKGYGKKLVEKAINICKTNTDSFKLKSSILRMRVLPKLGRIGSMLINL
jgi:GNAT superfamily N-acetyltransferase